MQIIEVKNNLVKASYDTAQESLVLSGFVVIKDVPQSFIGQIISLDANSKGNFAIVKLIFTFDDNGVIESYNGSIPQVSSPIEAINSQELLELFPVENPIKFGELAQQNIELNLDRTIFENNLLVACENEDNKELLTNNFVSQLVAANKKVLVIDLNGTLSFSQNKVVASEDFKLPLNYNSINFIYEKGLDNAAPETKALIQEVFLEVQNYVKTLPEKFIPFESFKNVVDSQYEEMQIVELLLLKNKLLKYYEDGVFAQDKGEFDLLEMSLKDEEPTIFDLSKVDGNVQREMISYVYDVISSLKQEVYVFFNVEDENSDKKLLKQVFSTANAYSTLICTYSYKYLKELKQLSKTLILFSPIKQQDDFAVYKVFLNKLNSQEFIVYGKSTHNIPFIVKLKVYAVPAAEKPAKPQVEVETEVEFEPQVQREALYEEDLEQEDLEPDNLQDNLDYEIKRDVDSLYTAPKQAINQSVQEEYDDEEDFSAEVVSDELSDEDLDFIDDLGEGKYDVPNEEFDVESVDEIESTRTEFLPEEEISDEVFEEETLYQEPEAQEVQDFEAEEEYEDELEEEKSEETFSNVMQQQSQQPTVAQNFNEEPPAIEILPASMSNTPIVPIYPAEVEPQVQSDEIEQGDVITHPKYGKGTVEKLINYGSKTLCSINFDNVGRRLLDPNLAELKKVNGE